MYQLGTYPILTSENTAENGVRPQLAKFVLRTLAWLPPAFILWYLAAPLLLAPAVLLAQGSMRAAFSNLVVSVEQSAAIVTFTTTLKPGATTGGVISVDVNLLLYSFGLPMFAALTLAARERNWARHLALGYAVLQPLFAWGAMADFLKNIAMTAGPFVASQTGFADWQREAIAFAYQFGSLILPAVAPAVLWVAMHGRFLESLRRPVRAPETSPARHDPPSDQA